ncbi:General substrate transporter [Cordyceps fumosorosea ARSEF 2679]|uniref:General substrate transporter n=1 Tax=Cordyceps fumosorosea (strain ARSEF 2679) TaxID=1081104 RepID=A0A162JL86_CORFA|nr:General substrate transporter [Cordyceps fumosorosea ARSEF 2679]OAA70612.1 General substrate transporter [Cordyceps fumosorosea ARSEF 2679]
MQQRQLNPGSIARLTTPAAIFSLALVFFSAFNYGFSDQSFASTQATTAFTRQFGEYNAKTHKYALTTVYLSLLNSIKAGTQLVGVFIGSWISNRYGRRACICAMSVYALGSTAVIVSSSGRAQMLVGRSIHYIYLGMQLSVIPTFLAEISPPRLRGTAGASYWLAIKFGGLIVTSIVRGTSTIKGNASWRIPISLILVIPAFIIPLVWFIPESPRWLLLRGKRDAALASLTRLRQSRADRAAQLPPSEPVIQELDDLSDAIERLRRETAESHPNHKGSRSIAAGFHLRQFFAMFSRRHCQCTAVCVGLLFFQQSTGQSFASQYGTLFVKALHTINPFSVALGINAIDIGAILICMALVDRVGRRSLLVASALLQTASLMIMGGLGVVAHASDTAQGAASASAGAKAGIVAMLMLYSFGWSFGYAPLAYVVAAELPSPFLREYTLRLAYSVKLIMEFVISFTYPYLEDVNKGNLGGRLGFIYGSLAFLALLFSIFAVPETKHIELEDMAIVFEKHQLRHGKLAPAGSDTVPGDKDVIFKENDSATAEEKSDSIEPVPISSK